MSAATVSNSAESLFWFSVFSRILNFRDYAPERRTRKIAGSAAEHPDVYFYMTLLPFLAGTGRA